MKKLTKISSLVLFILFVVTSCASRIDKRGYSFDMSDHELLREGVTSKERVLKIMGSPTLISDLDADEAWIYYSEDLKNFLFFRPETISRTILVLRFDNYDTLKELQKIGLSDEESHLNFAANFTNVESKKTGFLKSLFGNVGQIKSQ